MTAAGRTEQTESPPRARRGVFNCLLALAVLTLAGCASLRPERESLFLEPERPAGPDSTLTTEQRIERVEETSRGRTAAVGGGLILAGMLGVIALDADDPESLFRASFLALIVAGLGALSP